jgi:predicted RNase H-like nuclease (RuvC/YqgF family)
MTNIIGLDPRNQLPANIEELANKICEKMNEIENLEEKLKEDSRSLEMWKNELSELLDNCGYAVGSKISLKNGRQIKLKEFFSASIPSKSAIESCKDSIIKEELINRKQDCFDWLQSNGLSDIIKNNIIASLPKGSNDLANEISEYLMTKSVPHTVEENVHHSTLTATLKEQAKKGISIPFETFSINTGVAVEIK